jgi:uncharacterized repeat protein (TIGR03803 family)
MTTFSARKSSRLKAAIVSVAFSILLVGSLLASQPAHAQTYTVVHNFAGYPTDGAYPNGELIQDAAGNFYGTTSSTVFKLDPSGVETTLYSFTGGTDGAGPEAGLFRDPEGNLYGTTAVGGAYGFGTVFKLGTSNVLTTLYSFKGGSDGAHPESKLISINGDLYGTTKNGGSSSYCSGSGCGTIFKITKGGNRTILHRFYGYNNGAFPQGLISDSAGNIYGTTLQGGSGVQCANFTYATGCGTVFKLDTAGVFTVLFRFGNGSGAFPSGRLIRDANGNLTGVLEGGSSTDLGAVFRLDSSGGVTRMHNFWGGGGGWFPTAGLLNVGGTLYGTALYGGDLNCKNSDFENCGVLYQIGKTGQYTVLHRFAGPSEGDGAVPGFGQLAVGSDGSIYGVTRFGGTGSCAGGNPPQGCGVIFKYTP